jgi:predicted amino acid racemase
MLCDTATAQALGERAPGLPIEVLLTVDLGDRREGVLPGDAGTVLAGISVNFACLSGQLPSVELFRDAEAVLSTVADAGDIDGPLLSLGGSCCLQCLAGFVPRFRTEIRSGGGPLYGYDFVSAAPLEGLERVDPILSATVLESFFKPPAPPGAAGLDAFGHVPDTTLPHEPAWHALIALGRRDCEPQGLRPLLEGAYIAGMTSDVGMLITPRELRPGEAVEFALDYDALVRAVTSPFVSQRFVSRTVGGASPTGGAQPTGGASPTSGALSTDDTPSAAPADPDEAP